MNIFKLRRGESNLGVPIAIVVAGVLVAGAVLYTNTSKAPSSEVNDTTAVEVDDSYEYARYVNLAGELGLDGEEFKACMDAFDTNEVKKDLSDASQYGASGTPTFFIGVKRDNNQIEAVKVVGAQPYPVFQGVIDSLLADGDINNAINALPENMRVDQAGNAVEVQAVTVSLDDDPITGGKDSNIVILEFSDYECPFCKRYIEGTYSQIKQQYLDNGKVMYVYRDLPLSFHDPVATEEAVAANCARAQAGDEGYYQYHDEIFARTGSNKEGI